MEPLPVATVLVVEDEPTILDLLVHTLRSEGYTVVQARHGQEAIRVIEHHQAGGPPLCLVLLDLMLPDMDGLQVQRYVQEHGITVPIITMSASPTLLGEAMRQGSHIGVGKPFDLDEILALVETYCSPPAE